MIDGIAYKPDVIMIIGYAKSRNEENAVMTDLMAALMFMTPIFDIGRSETGGGCFQSPRLSPLLEALQTGASFIMDSNSVGTRICSATSRGICFDASR